MLIPNLRQAVRNLRVRKLSTAINLIGLLAGLTSVMFILLFILNELSYDRYHEKGRRIYRVLENNLTHQWIMATTPFGLAEAIAESSPAVEAATRIHSLGPLSVRKEGQWIQEGDLYSADPSLFGIFTFPLLTGNAEELGKPGTAIITESNAVKYFGDREPINRTLEIRMADTVVQARVVGIMKEPPLNITLRPGMILSADLGLLNMSKSLITTGGEPPSKEDIAGNWGFNFFTTYLLIRPGADTSQVNAAFRSLEAQHYGEEGNYTFRLQPLRDVYLGSGELINAGARIGDRQTVYIFAGIGILILIISLLNYILLLSGQTILRSKEYGIRKVLGASGNNLLGQLLTETFLLVVLVLPFCLAAIEILRPVASRFLDKNIVIESQLAWKYPAGLILLTLLAGSIPGIAIISFISRIRPMQVFEGAGNPRKGQSLLRTLLIYCQFILFNLMILCSLGIYRQNQYFMDRDLGYEWKNRLIVSLTQGSLAERFGTIKEELSSIPGIISISGGMFLPPTNSVMSINLPKLDESGETVNLEAFFVDRDFLQTMGIKLLEGQSIADFSDRGGWKILLNRKAVDVLGRDNPIGEKLMGGEVVGITGDFNVHSLHQAIPPTMIISGGGNLRQMVVYCEPGLLEQVRNRIENTLETILPGSLPQVNTMETVLKEMYRKERETSSILAVFTLIAVIIGAMGLFGMSMHMLQNRKKEFAVRKVNGAGTGHVLWLLARSYLILILAAVSLAAPLAFLLTERWLRNFAYRVSLAWWIFAVSAGLSLLIVAVTVGYHTVIAARRNPAGSLRYE